MQNPLKKIHPSWYMAVLVTLVLFIGVGLFSSTNNVFMKPICDDLGFSRAEYSLHRTLITLVSVFFLPVYAKLLKKLGFKKIFLFAAAATALLLCGFSFCSRIGEFYVIAVLQGIFNNGLSFFVAGAFINAWFIDSKGLATAIAYCGTGLGGAVFSPIIGSILEQIGWRWAYRGMAAVGFLAILPIILLLRDRPEELHTAPFRKAQPSGAPEVMAAVVPEEEHEYTLAEAKATPVFWILLVTYFLISLCSSGPYYHTTAFLSDAGYTLLQATSLTAFFQLMLTLAKLVIGVVFDKFGLKVGSATIALALIACPLAALFIHLPFAPWLYCILLGFIGAGSGLALNLFLGKLFGRKDFASILSVYTMVTTLSGSFSSPLMGAIYDASGSYQIAWIALLLIGLASSVGLLLVNLHQRRAKKAAPKSA